jgi:hypothetical protein
MIKMLLNAIDSQGRRNKLSIGMEGSMKTIIWLLWKMKKMLAIAVTTVVITIVNGSRRIYDCTHSCDHDREWNKMNVQSNR